MPTHIISLCLNQNEPFAGGKYVTGTLYDLFR